MLPSPMLVFYDEMNNLGSKEYEDMSLVAPNNAKVWSFKNLGTICGIGQNAGYISF